jgi:hypothetical protein
MTTDLTLFRDKVFTLRGQQVMLDLDVAQALGTDTAHLNRNAKDSTKWEYLREEGIEEKFRFQLTAQEYDEVQMRSKSGGTSALSQRRDDYLPWVYTQFGCNYFAASMNTGAACLLALQMTAVFVAVQAGELPMQFSQALPLSQEVLQLQEQLKLEDMRYQGQKRRLESVEDMNVSLKQELREYKNAELLRKRRKQEAYDRKQYLKRIEAGYAPHPRDTYFDEIPEGLWALHPEAYARTFPGREPLSRSVYNEYKFAPRKDLIPILRPKMPMYEG